MKVTIKPIVVLVKLSLLPWVMFCYFLPRVSFLPHLEVVSEGLDFHDFLCFLSVPMCLWWYSMGTSLIGLTQPPFQPFPPKIPFIIFINFKISNFVFISFHLLEVSEDTFFDTSNMLDTCRSLRKNTGARWQDLK